MTGLALATAWLEREGALLRLRLARPKANIIDAAMTAALAGALARFTGTADMRAVLLDHDGPNFSFGASVEEHLPGQCKAMLEGFHGLITQLLDCPVPVLVAARGQCLGGGLEVATAGTLIFAAPDAKLGQPEMQLGVFAPGRLQIVVEDQPPEDLGVFVHLLPPVLVARPVPLHLHPVRDRMPRDAVQVVPDHVNRFAMFAHELVMGHWSVVSGQWKGSTFNAQYSMLNPD